MYSVVWGQWLREVCVWYAQRSRTQKLSVHTVLGNVVHFKYVLLAKIKVFFKYFNWLKYDKFVIRFSLSLLLCPDMTLLCTKIYHIIPPLHIITNTNNKSFLGLHFCSTWEMYLMYRDVLVRFDLGLLYYKTYLNCLKYKGVKCKQTSWLTLIGTLSSVFQSGWSLHSFTSVFTCGTIVSQKG